MALLSPNQDLAEETRAAMERQLDQQTRDAMKGVLMRPGRGKKASQWVASGSEFNNLTQDEVYGRLRARQGGNSGSGPGGGLRSGGLSQGSGIDWLHENGPSRYDAVGGINQAQRNVKFTGDASVMSKPDKALFDKAAADKEAKAAADKAAADKAAATTSTPSVPDFLNTPVGQTAKPAIPPMIARPAEPAAPAKPVGMAPPGAPNYQAPPVAAAPVPAAPPVLAKPQVTTAAAPASTFTPSPNPVLESAKAMLAKSPAPTYGGAYANQFNPSDPKRFEQDPAFQSWRRKDPDAIANSQKHAKTIEDWNNHLGAVNQTKKAAEQNMRNVDTFEEAQSKLGLISIGSDQYNKTKKFADDSYKFGKDTAAAVAKNLANPGNRLYKPVPDILTPPPAAPATASDDRSKASPLAVPSNPLDPVKTSQNPRTRGIPPVGGTPTPPVLQKPAPPNNQTVVGNPANKRKTNPLSDMLKGLV